MAGKPTLAVCGAGGWGSFHADNAIRTADWDTVAFVDSNPEVLRKLREERGVPASRLFADIEEALAATRPDAATLSIPNPGRIPYLERILRTGASVLADKPLAHVPAHLRAIRGALTDGGGMLMVGQNYRFDPDVRAAKDMIESRVYGALEHVTVHFAIEARFTAQGFYKELTGGTLLLVEMGCHHFDMMRYLLGSDPVEVYGRSWPSASGWIKGDTGAHALISFRNGTRVTYDADWNTHGKLTDWGADWTLQFENATVRWKPRTGESPAIVSLDPDLPTDIWPGLVGKYPSAPNYMELAFREFTVAFAEKRRPECDFEDNVRSLAIPYAIMESGATGQAVVFDDFLDREVF